MKIPSFDKWTGNFTILGGISAFAYSYSFVVLSRSNPELGGRLSALFLLLGGLFAISAFMGVYERVRGVHNAFALEALLFGFVGAAGMAVHGGYDLANSLNGANVTFALATLPNQVDPRGLLTFGFVGLALLKFSHLMQQKGSGFSKGLSGVGYLSGVALVLLYVARLVVLDPANPWVLYPALLNGFVLGPVWYLWLGTELWNGRRG